MKLIRATDTIVVQENISGDEEEDIPVLGVTVDSLSKPAADTIECLLASTLIRMHDSFLTGNGFSIT